MPSAALNAEVTLRAAARAAARMEPTRLLKPDVQPSAVRLPAVMPSDRTAMQFALRTATDCDWEKGPRIVWLKNTLSLSEFYISEALIPDAEALDNVTIVSEPMEVIFDEEGNVKELR